MRAFPTLAAIFLLILSSNHLTLANRPLNSGSSEDSNKSVLNASVVDQVPTIAFCEMVKNPKLYFEKTVRVVATLQLTEEAAYLEDDKCILSHNDQIGVNYVSDDDEQRKLLNGDIRKIRSIEYGSRAKVTVVGVLRNSSVRAFAWYRYRFDVSRVEGMTPVIVPYEGTLQGGITYRAAVRGDRDIGLSFVLPLRMAEHFAVHIEWINLREFPAVARLRSGSPEQWIVFTVVSDQIKQMTERRWNRTVECKIISVN